MFRDIHEQIGAELIEHRAPGATFDEVLYADGTICISATTQTINKLIERIESSGDKYGLVLNHKECEVLTTASNLTYISKMKHEPHKRTKPLT